MGKFKNENWDKFWVLDGKKVGKNQNFLRLKFFEVRIYACPEELHFILPDT